MNLFQAISALVVVVVQSAIPSVLAAPVPDNLSKITAASILEIAPSSGDCNGAQYQDECATNEHAARMMSFSLSDFQTTSPGELTALIALMAFETDEFKYNKKHFPPTPGQGTRSMMSPQFVVEYGAVFPTLKAEYNAVKTDPEQVLDLLIKNKVDFGSASWYLNVHCPAVKQKLQQGLTTDIWNEYLTECLQTTADPKRDEYMQRAAKVFGVQV